MNLKRRIETLWYCSAVKPPWVLRLLARLYGFFVGKRRRYLQSRAYRSSLPVVVVGNLTVGGNGKSPVVLALAKACRARGLRPVIVTRGYKSQKRFKRTHWVQATDRAHDIGDEALMLHLQAQVPVLVNPDRVQAIREAEQKGDIDLLILDDGLQHYPLASDLKLCVVDASRGFGNKYLLPAGPLREPIDRLETVDRILINGAADNLGIEELGFTAVVIDKIVIDNIKLLPAGFLHWPSGHFYPKDHFQGQAVTAIAGIGHPERFESMLSSLGATVTLRYFKDDHHVYQAREVHAWQTQHPVITTAKDWVKLKKFPGAYYVLMTDVQLPEALIKVMLSKVHMLCKMAYP